MASPQLVEKYDARREARAGLMVERLKTLAPIEGSERLDAQGNKIPGSVITSGVPEQGPDGRWTVTLSRFGLPIAQPSARTFDGVVACQAAYLDEMIANAAAEQAARDEAAETQQLSVEEMRAAQAAKFRASKTPAGASKADANKGAADNKEGA